MFFLSGLTPFSSPLNQCSGWKICHLEVLLRDHSCIPTERSPQIFGFWSCVCKAFVGRSEHIKKNVHVCRQISIFSVLVWNVIFISDVWNAWIFVVKTPLLRLRLSIPWSGFFWWPIRFGDKKVVVVARFQYDFKCENLEVHDPHVWSRSNVPLRRPRSGQSEIYVKLVKSQRDPSLMKALMRPANHLAQVFEGTENSESHMELSHEEDGEIQPVSSQTMTSWTVHHKKSDETVKAPLPKCLEPNPYDKGGTYLRHHNWWVLNTVYFCRFGTSQGANIWGVNGTSKVGPQKVDLNSMYLYEEGEENYFNQTLSFLIYESDTDEEQRRDVTVILYLADFFHSNYNKTSDV